MHRLFESFTLGLDISPSAMSASRETAYRHGVPLELARMNLLSALKPGTVDLLTFNPPYVPTTKAALDAGLAAAGEACETIDAASWVWAGGPNGRVLHDRLVASLHALLSPNGVAFILFYEAALDVFVAHGLRARVIAERKRGPETFVIVECERAATAKVGLIILPATSCEKF
jgi:release factor glutamine methyltransferase